MRTEPDRLLRADAAEPGIVGTETDRLLRPDAAEPGIVRAEPDRLLRPDAAEPGVMRAEPDRLFRPDAAEPGVMRAEPDRLFRPDAAEPGVMRAEPDRLFRPDAAEPGVMRAEPGPMETVGDTRLRHLTCLSDDAIDSPRRWTGRRNIDRNANKKNVNSCPPLSRYCDRPRASGVSRRSWRRSGPSREASGV